MRNRYQIDQATKQVTPAMKELFVDKMPDTPGTAVCEFHGEYTFKYSEMLGGKVLRMSCCCKCVEARDNFIDSEVTRLNREAKEKKIEEGIISSGVSKRNLGKTFDSYVVTTPAQAKAKQSWQDFASSVSNGVTASNLITCGSVGVGKTHLASSAVAQITSSGKKCRLIKIIDLIRQFKSTWSKDVDATEEEFLEFYTTIPALIIDEVGVQFGSDTEKMVVFDIIDGRYNNMLPTALISNLAMPEVKELIGERVIDRLREDGGVVVGMSWESHRGLK